MTELIGTDRYEALGIPPPDPETACDGECEGTGVVPVYMHKGDPKYPHGARPFDEEDPELTRRWEAAEAQSAADDGYHFVTCPTCEGSRLRVATPQDRAAVPPEA